MLCEYDGAVPVRQAGELISYESDRGYGNETGRGRGRSRVQRLNVGLDLYRIVVHSLANLI